MEDKASLVQSLRESDELYKSIVKLTQKLTNLQKDAFNEKAPNKQEYFQKVEQKKQNKIVEAESARESIEKQIRQSQERIKDEECSCNCKLAIHSLREEKKKGQYSIIIALSLCLITLMVGILFHNWITIVVLGINIVLVTLYFLTDFRVSRILYSAFRKSKAKRMKESILEESEKAKREINDHVIGLNRDLLAIKERENAQIQRITTAYEQNKKEVELKYKRDFEIYTTRKKEFEKKKQLDIQSVEKELSAYSERLKNTSPVSQKYYQDLSEITDIIDSGRANSVKEALNILEDDKAKQRQLDAIYERNREIERANREIERANRERQEELEMQGREMIKALEKGQRAAAACAGCRKASLCLHYGDPNLNCKEY